MALSRQTTPGEAHLLISFGGCGADMIRENNYKNDGSVIDTDKLRGLIEELKDIRFGRGLPEKIELPNRLTICENLLSQATPELRNRYLDLSAKQAQKVREDVAWEVAEWYYTSAYNFYMKAKEEKAKYDEVQKKIDKLDSVLDELVQRLVCCCWMAKMLACGVVRYDPKHFRYVYELNEEDVELVAIELPFLKVREMKLYEELERLRKGNPIEQRLYELLCDRAYDGFDAVLERAYEKAHDERLGNGKYSENAVYIKRVIEQYKKLANVRSDAESRKNAIEHYFQHRKAISTYTRNLEIKDFYNVYFKGIDDEIWTSSDLSARVSSLGIVDAEGNLKPDNDIFQEAQELELPKIGWKCPECDHEGNTGNFCPNCGARRQSWKCPERSQRQPWQILLVLWHSQAGELE